MAPGIGGFLLYKYIDDCVSHNYFLYYEIKHSTKHGNNQIIER